MKVILAHHGKYRKLFNKIKVNLTISSKENSSLLLGIFVLVFLWTKICFFSKTLLFIACVHDIVVTVQCKIE